MTSSAIADAYERGHDDALDEAMEDVRVVLADHPELRHALERRLIARYSPAGRAESPVLGQTQTPAGAAPAGREERE